MNVQDINTYRRMLEVADGCGVKISLSGNLIAMSRKDKVGLGGYYTVEEVYAFLCGYEHYASYVQGVLNIQPPIENESAEYSYDWAIKRLRKEASCTAVVKEVDENVFSIDVHSVDGTPILVKAICQEEHYVQFILEAIREAHMEIQINS